MGFAIGLSGLSLSLENFLPIWMYLNQAGDVKLFYTNIHLQRWSLTDSVMTHVESESMEEFASGIQRIIFYVQASHVPRNGDRQVQILIPLIERIRHPRRVIKGLYWAGCHLPRASVPRYNMNMRQYQRLAELTGSKIRFSAMLSLDANESDCGTLFDQTAIGSRCSEVMSAVAFPIVLLTIYHQYSRAIVLLGSCHILQLHQPNISTVNPAEQVNTPSIGK